jgi:hypothetical protein
MTINTLRALVALANIFACGNLALAMEDKCSTSSNILILDRTHGISGPSKNAYELGIQRLLNDNSLAGSLVAVELRERGNGFTLLANECLQRIPSLAEIDDRIKKKLEGNRTGVDKAFDFIYRNSAREKELYNRELAKEQEIVLSENGRRKAVYAKLLSASSGDNVELTRDVDILSTLATLLRDRCAGSVSCRIWVFSNMIDWRSRNVFSDGAKDPIQLGSTHAGYVRDPFPPSSWDQPVPFAVWGFGRNDGPKELGDYQKAQLEKFWQAAISGLRPAGLPEARGYEPT